MDNKILYSKGKLTFKTFAKDLRLAEANVNDYIDLVKTNKWKKEIIIWEFGVGTGDYAYNFLTILNNKNPELLNNTKYIMHDFSNNFLEQCKLKLKEFNNIEYVPYDATKNHLSGNVHYVRMNEFWDDLPAKIEQIKDSPYKMINNRVAERNLRQIARCLYTGGTMDIFDYGFTEINLTPEEWNNSLKRETDHETFDINFNQMITIANELELKPNLDFQDDYVSNHFTPELRYVELKDGLFYLTQKEIEDKHKELEKLGYSKEFIKGQFNEKSEHYHLRIVKE